MTHCSILVVIVPFSSPELSVSECTLTVSSGAGYLWTHVVSSWGAMQSIWLLVFLYNHLKSLSGFSFSSDEPLRRHPRESRWWLTWRISRCRLVVTSTLNNSHSCSSNANKYPYHLSISAFLKWVILHTIPLTTSRPIAHVEQCRRQSHQGFCPPVLWHKFKETGLNCDVFCQKLRLDLCSVWTGREDGKTDARIEEDSCSGHWQLTSYVTIGYRKHAAILCS